MKHTINAGCTVPHTFPLSRQGFRTAIPLLLLLFLLLYFIFTGFFWTPAVD